MIGVVFEFWMFLVRARMRLNRMVTCSNELFATRGCGTNPFVVVSRSGPSPQAGRAANKSNEAGAMKLTWR